MIVKLVSEYLTYIILSLDKIIQKINSKMLFDIQNNLIYYYLYLLYYFILK